MQRTLTGVAVVALALGLQACRKGGSVDPDKQGGVARTSHEGTEARLAPTPSPTPGLGAQSAAVAAATPSSITEHMLSERRGYVEDGYDEEGSSAAKVVADWRLFTGLWVLKKQDGTFLTLKALTPTAGTLEAEYKESGESVKVRQYCQALEDARGLKVTCEDPVFVGDRPKGLKYEPDRLLFMRREDGGVQVFAFHPDPKKGPTPVEVVYRSPGDLPGSRTKARARE